VRACRRANAITFANTITVSSAAVTTTQSAVFSDFYGDRDRDHSCFDIDYD
jgi:hypothetical protein